MEIKKINMWKLRRKIEEGNHIIWCKNSEKIYLTKENCYYIVEDNGLDTIIRYEDENMYMWMKSILSDLSKVTDDVRIFYGIYNDKRTGKDFTDLSIEVWKDTKRGYGRTCLTISFTDEVNIENAIKIFKLFLNKNF